MIHGRSYILHLQARVRISALSPSGLGRALVHQDFSVGWTPHPEGLTQRSSGSRSEGMGEAVTHMGFRTPHVDVPVNHIQNQGTSLAVGA